MDKNLSDWTEICKKFCHDRGYTLLFVNSDNFGFSDDKEELHHVYAEELTEWLKGEK